MANGFRADLAVNAGTGNQAAKSYPGGKGYFVASATFGGGSVKLQMKLPDVAGTWVDVPSASFTAAGAFAVDLPAGEYRAVNTTATAVYAYLIRA